MHIHDFYSKLTTNEGGPLFEALRSLSRIEDPTAMAFDLGSIIPGNWPQWPSMEAHASYAASEGE